ncbi:tape measure protein [Mycobacterium phage Rando14]|uniref:Tape measure protein n=1 Tax=Mycobacterium phage Rando14 TaxID=2301556 RepID=A0A385D4R7_9CAUD|nr:endolysin [Mycobacterium phage Rando14]AXQ53039.1 tape measure protein [Mycobacterium phage Rando14]
MAEAKYYLTILPETRELEAGIRTAAERAGRGLVVTPRFDTSGASRAGQTAGRDINRGLGSSNVGEGLGARVARSLGDGASIGRNFGSRMASGMDSAMSVAGGVVLGNLVTKIGGAVSGAFRSALQGGFSRLTSIDSAQFKLKSLGHEAQATADIMKDATAAVKGTAFGLDEAANTAASAVAAGIKPGQDLTRYLSLTADAAAIAGVSMSEMGSIVNKVQTSGKAYTMELTQLADRGLPIFQWLQEEYGVTGEELSKMVADGQVDSATFQRVIEKNIGGAAKGMGGSFLGSIANMKAAMNRFGAELLAPVFKGIQPLAGGLTTVIDQITAGIKAPMGQITDLASNWAEVMAQRMVAWTEGGGLTRITDFLSRIGDAIRDISSGNASGQFGQIVEMFKDIGPSMSAAGSSFATIGQTLARIGPEVLTSVLVPGLQLAAGALKFLADNASWAVPTLVGLRVALAAHAAVAGTVAVATNAAGIATGIWSGITKAATAAQWLWNAALTANPIGLIVAGVVAAGVAIWAFFTKTETGRKLWDKIWTGVKAVASSVWDWLKTAWQSVWDTIGPTLSRIGQAASVGFSALGTAIRSVWQFIQPAVAAFGRLYAAVLRLQFNIVVAGFRVLGNVIAWLWRNIAVPAFSAIGAAASGLWSVVGVVWDLFTAALRGVGNVIGWLWREVGVPAFDAIRNAVQAFWQFAQPVWDLLTAAIDKIGDRLAVVRDVFVAVFGKIKDVVKDAWDAVGGIFDKITGGINKVADRFGGVGGGANGGTVGGGRVLPGYATGGRISGPGTGTSDSILGFPAMVRVANGEFITNAAATARNLPLLQAINAGRPADELMRLLPRYASGGLTAHTSGVRDYISRAFGIGDIGGWRPEDGYGEHSTGNALDVMIPNWQSAEGQALGNQITGWALKNASALGLTGVIWRQASYGYGNGFDGTGKPMEDRGSPTQNHMDHVHLFMNDAPDPNVSLVGPSVSPLGGSLSGSGSAGSVSSASGGGSYRAATSAELTSSSNKVDSARTSAKNADQSVDDAQYRVKKAEQRLADAQAKGKGVEDADRSLMVAKRELQDAIERQTKAHDKLTEAENADTELRTKGKLSKSGGGSSSEGGLSGADFGKTFVSGVLESIGLDGSLFSNPLEWPTVKSLMAGINFAGGLLSGSGGEQSAGGGGFADGVAESTGLGGLFKALSGGEQAFTAESGSPKLAPGEFNPAVANNATSVAGSAADALSAFLPAVHTGQGNAPGPVDNSITINNPVGSMPQPWRDQVHAEQNARTRTTHVR